MPSGRRSRPVPTGGRFGGGGRFNGAYLRAAKQQKMMARSAGIFKCRACEMSVPIKAWNSASNLHEKGKGPDPGPRPPRCNRGHHVRCPKSKRNKALNSSSRSLEPEAQVTHVFMHVCIHTYPNEFRHIYIYIYIHTYIHTYICTRTHTHTMHACMHMYSRGLPYQRARSDNGHMHM